MSKTIPLSDVVDVSAGQPAPKPQEFSDNGYPFIRAGSVESLLNGSTENDCEKIDTSIAKKRRLKLFPIDTVVFAKSGMSAKIGRVYRLRQPAYVVSHLAALVPTGKYDPSFLTHWLRQNPPSRLIKDDAYPSIRVSAIAGLEVPDLAIGEQRRIAAILDKADAIRRKREQALNEADALLESYFEFTQRKYAEEALLLTLADVAANGRNTFSNGPFGSNLLTSELTDLGVPVIYIRDIKNSRYERVSSACVTEEKAADLAACAVTSGDVLIAKVGDPPGTAAVYPDGEPDAIVTQDVIRLRPDPERATAEYIKSLLNSKYGKHILSSITVEATRARFGLGQLKKTKFSFLPLDRQIEFSSHVERLTALRSVLNSQIADAEILFASLSQRAFRGEL